jgi:siderophore synthetase component
VTTTHGIAADGGTNDGDTADESADDGDTDERELAARVIDTLLREDYGGLSKRVRLEADGPVLDLPAGDGGAGPVLPLDRDGFLADLRIRRTAAGSSGGSGPPLTLDDVDAALAAVGDPRDGAGVAAFAAECRQALATLRLRARYLPGAHRRLAERQAGPDALSGPRGLLTYEALAATLPHPAYPTGESRPGFGEEDALRYAPEYAPEFELHWVAVPRSLLVTAGRPDRPPGWPTAPDVGLPESIAATHELMPVHPFTARHALARALTEIGALTGDGCRALIAPGTGLLVTPTLSMRTVALTGRPAEHLKLPLPTSTLGLLNRRFIPPGTLADGALVRDVLATAASQDARLGNPLLGSLLLADEGTYAHAGHPGLGYLLRRLPPGLGRCRIVPVAALLASGPDAVMVDRWPHPDVASDPPSSGTGPAMVMEELAGWGRRGDLPGLFADYLDVLFGVHVRLFARYGIALESHQQNTALVLGPPGDAAGLRLLVKDLDGALIHLPRLTQALGPAAPEESAFADPRLLTRSDDALADVFITITVHLCAGALAFGLARRGAAPLPDLLALVRRKLTAALDDHAGWPATSVLRARVLDADRLVGKSMVTAGTLVAKARTGASDINKFYGTNGPNYLRADTALQTDTTLQADTTRSCQ